MFIRFVTANCDVRSGRRQRALHAGNLLLEENALSASDADKLQQTFDWFDANLPHPTRFSLSARPNRQAQALSWFKSTAVDHITKMRDYTFVLNENGLLTETLKTKRPGYEDEFQIVAYPFAKTPC